MMYTRYNVATTKKNAKIIHKLRQAGKLKNGKLPKGMVGDEGEAVARSWQAYREWIKLE